MRIAIIGLGVLGASAARALARAGAQVMVVTVRGARYPLRTTMRRPASSRSSANSARYAVTSASNAAASIRRAPSESGTCGDAAHSRTGPGRARTASRGSVPNLS